MTIVELLQEVLELDQANRLPEALSKLNQIEKQIPEAPQFQKIAGLLYQRLGDDGKSFNYLTQAFKHLPRDAEILFGLGCYYTDQAEQEKAIELFSSAIDIDATMHMAYVYSARAHELRGNISEALELAKKACVLAKEATPYFTLGRLQIRANDLAAAANSFRQLAEIEPGEILADIGLNRVQALQNGKVGEAGAARAPESTSVVCIKWGDKYGPEYVNRLASMVRRHTTHMPRFICFTENTTGINPEIESRPLPAPDLKGWWNKIALFKKDIADLGERILFLDLDTVITDSLDQMLTYGSDLVFKENEYSIGFSTTAFLLKVGSRAEIWENFTPELADSLRGDQDWVGLMAPDAMTWPLDWCVDFSLKAAQNIPTGAKVVCFGDRPNPEDYPAHWVRKHWH